MGVITQGDLTSEWVQAHGVGRVVPPDDTDAVACAILDLLADRDALTPAFDPLHARFTWDRVVEQLLSVYESVRRQRLIVAPRRPQRVRTAGPLPGTHIARSSS